MAVDKQSTLLVPPLTGTRLTDLADEEPPDLHKEKSTLGELVSITDRGIRRESDVRSRPRRNSYTQGEGDVTDRRRQLRRQSSSSSVVSDDLPAKRRGSLYRKNSLSLGFLSNRETSTTRPEPDKQTTGTDGGKKKPTRRDSMLQLVRDELDKIPCLTALSKHQQRKSVGAEDNPFSDSASDDDKPQSNRGTRKRMLRRLSSNPAMLRRESRLSSSGSESILTDAELRKLRMIESLNKMGNLPRSRVRNDSITSASGEVAILEESRLGTKRGSIATRVLVAASRRQLSDRLHVRKTPDIPALPATEELTEDQKQQAQKTIESWKKPDKPTLPGIPTNKLRGAAGTEEVAVESMNVFRRRLRRRKLKPGRRFRKLTKFIVLLLRAWRIHSNAINDVLVDNNDSLDMITRSSNKLDLLFDITQYKADKEAKVSQEAKRILRKKPAERTEDERYYIQIALRNYKSIAEYPVKMQKMIAQRSWIESFDLKRVIVREGHVPMCFYFILSGSAVVTKMEGNNQKTVMFLNRGDSFGDIAILNGNRRETTVISREPVELLVMTDTDFIDIFMSGGLRDPDDPFLKSIGFLEGWPLVKLIENPKKCIFSYFKRGTVLVNDSTANDWIFVVKSGSASILKKLLSVNPKRPKPKPKQSYDFRDEVMELVKQETQLSHEEQLQLMFEEEVRGLEDQNLLVRYFALPEINIKTNDSYNELKMMREEYVNANSVARAIGALEKMADAGDVRSEAGDNMSEANTMSVASLPLKNQQQRKMSLSNMLAKGPFLAKARGGRRSSLQHSASSRTGQGSVPERQSSPEGKNPEGDKKVDDWQGMSLPSLAASPMNDLTIKPQERQPVFVEVQNLTKGQNFGMAQMLFDGQPSFSLVSNGAECIMIDKKFYMEHASQSLMVRMREQTYPYPSDDALQANLESQMLWDHHKDRMLEHLLKRVSLKKADPNDARAGFPIPTF